MTTGDMLRIGVGNLRRLKLRTFLTISGVVIAIGAFVSMLSFGAGNQRLVADQFEEMGLFTTVLVYPAEPGGSGDAATGSAAPVLDDEAVLSLARLPGVKLAYPYEGFDVTVTYGDSVVEAGAQALSSDALETRMFSRFVAGAGMAPEDTTGCLVGEDFLEELGVEEPRSLVGRQLRVAVRSVSADSGFLRVVRDTEGMRSRWESADRDSLGNRGYLVRYLQHELRDAARRFFDGYLSAQAETAETLTVRGVLRSGSRRAAVRPVILPVAAARRFAAAGPGGDPTELLPALLSGNLFATDGGGAATRHYSQVTLVTEPHASHVALTDSLEARGFRSFSYAADFEEIRRVLLFFNLGLAAVGFVALVTAALGIVNTMMMSVSERRREIGILKALGAEDRLVRFLSLVESGLVGFFGSVLGVVLGWGVARAGSAVAQEVMRRQDVTPMDVFATPVWLVLTAVAFGTLVSVTAGAMPAAHAARVDPVRALRNE